jgi:hypothetical protein
VKKTMQWLRIVLAFGVLLLVVGVARWSGIEAAESSSQLLTGELWQQMSADTKVAYIWGIGNLVEYERALMVTPPAESKSFFPLLIKGLSGKPINDVVRQIDAYYQTHPDERQRPVMDAMFQAVVIPALRTAQ